MSFIINEKNKIYFGTFPVFEKYDMIAAVSFRKGGESLPPFQSLNLGLHTLDKKEIVLKNREKFFSLLFIKPREIVTLKQVHGQSVIVVDKKDRGKGALEFNDSVASADAMITKEKDLALVVFTADCASLFFYEKRKKIMGLAHAGWKGTEKNIAGEVVRMMKGMGGDVKEILAAIGPCIGKCCYEVGEDFRARFDASIIEKRGERYYLDLAGANARNLVLAGIKKENIYTSSFCTSCHDDLCFSFRKEGETGRMASVVMMR